MKNLSVTPGYLDDLAKKQDEATAKAASGAAATDGITRELWDSHGLISGSSNAASSGLVSQRRAAGKAIAKATSDLAAKLRAAKAAYESVDAELGENLDGQVLPR